MLSKVIPSYLYYEYSDDEDLQAFVRAYNVLAQMYVDWFNNINLPIYTQLDGELLDWVGSGLYGISRPTIGSFFLSPFIGPLNTFMLNTIVFNGYPKITEIVLSDDVYKRIITWHFYKGDGKVFNILWLKRRIERFLFGANGTNYCGTTYRISVAFLNAHTVIIRLIKIIVNTLSGSVFNKFAMNSSIFNTIKFSIENLPQVGMFDVLKLAIDSKVLELPFQFDYIVVS